MSRSRTIVSAFLPTVGATMLATVLAAALAGCNTANTVVSTGTLNPDGTVAYRQITTNGWLRYKANIVGVRESTVSGDIRRVAVDVYSDQLTTQRFSYRFEWSDADGMPVRSATAAMTSVTIKPKETITITSVAPAPTATQWRLTFLDENR